MNKCILTGNLGQDPDIRYSQNGDPIATFSLAFRLSQEKTGWVKVVCFNKTAEIAETYLHKGAKVILSANLDYNQWENGEGQQRTSMQLIANRIEFIKTDGRGFEGGRHDTGDDPPF